MTWWSLHCKVPPQDVKFLGKNPHLYFFALRGLPVWSLSQTACAFAKPRLQKNSATVRWRPSCQPLVILFNFTTHCADLLSLQASSSLLRGKQSPDLASARQVGEIRDNHIKARGQRWLPVPSALVKVSGLAACELMPYWALVDSPDLWSIDLVSIIWFFIFILASRKVQALIDMLFVLLQNKGRAKANFFHLKVIWSK